MKSIVELYKEQHSQAVVKLEARREALEQVCAALEAEWNIELRVDPKGNVDVIFSGDKDRLQAVWTILRRAGFAPSHHINDEGDGPVRDFSCYWDMEGEGSRIWMFWTSTVCKQIVVGHKTITVPIYEVKCE